MQIIQAVVCLEVPHSGTILLVHWRAETVFWPRYSGVHATPCFMYKGARRKEKICSIVHTRPPAIFHPLSGWNSIEPVTFCVLRPRGLFNHGETGALLVPETPVLARNHSTWILKYHSIRNLDREQVDWQKILQPKMVQIQTTKSNNRKFHWTVNPRYPNNYSPHRNWRWVYDRHATTLFDRGALGIAPYPVNLQWTRNTLSLIFNVQQW